MRRPLVPILSSVLALLVVGCSPAVPQGDDRDETVRQIALGEPGNAGDLRFLVSAFECVGQTLTTGTQAEGTFCVATLSVENTGDARESFDASQQRLFDIAGRDYSPSTAGVGAFDNAQGPGFVAGIEPGQRFDLVFVYDIPADTTAVYLELNDEDYETARLKAYLS